MLHAVNQTHDPRVRSWVDSANVTGTDFPIQNLPLGVFRRRNVAGSGTVGVAIGTDVLDVAACARAGLFEGPAHLAARACEGPRLNQLMALGHGAWSALRHSLFDWLRADHPRADAHRRAVAPHLVPQADVTLDMPVTVGDYTDFYASVFHATNVGRMMRPDNPLLPNYKHVPIGYHGRASSLVVSGTPITRPHGQTRPDGVAAPVFGPSRRLDYELEVGLFIGTGNALGRPIAMETVEEHLFGVCLVNDWSARDVQAWEYQPLGPFLAKNFATTVSPWVVTLEALAPFRCPPYTRPDHDPAPLPYLDAAWHRERGAIALDLEVGLSTEQLRAAGIAPASVSSSRFADMYWTFAQMVVHHASNGCNLQPGDLLASGTVSGPDKGQRGCLLELTWRGTEPLALPTGETRTFLEDGDEVVFRGVCRREGFVPIGFGECRGVIEPARG